jgi:AcrR family transcriptional regulator
MKKSTQPAKRSYKSSIRESSTLRTRERIIACAHEQLRGRGGADRFSLETVAKRASITRATIYKGFGSRRLLLEAVLDLISDQGGLEQIPLALMQADPTQALIEVVDIFCRFWGTDTATLVCLHAAGCFDNEFEQSLVERNERRRTVLRTLANKIYADKNPHRSSDKSVVETLFALTSLGFYQSLVVQNSNAVASRIVQELCLHVVQSAHQK